MNDKDGDTFDEAVEERVINEEYKVWKIYLELTLTGIFAEYRFKYWFILSL